MKLKEFVAFLGMVFICCGVAVAGISFIDPTPINNSRIYVNYTNINVSIPVDDLTNFTFNWNGTNTTYLNDSCVLHLSFDNNSEIGDSSTVVRDVSSYNNNGSFVNGTTGTWTADGKWDGGMEFDGVNDCVNCGNDPSLNITDAITVSMWMKPAFAHGNYEYILSKRDSTKGYYIVSGATAEDWLNFVVKIGGVSKVAKTNIYPLAGQWSHIIGSYNGSRVRIYMNGVEQTSGTNVVGKITGTANPLEIMGFNGSIDEVRIYNRALSPAEVRQSYLSNLRKFNKSQWYFETNQTDLIDGEYNYQVFANNITNNYITDYRLLFVGYESTFIPPNPINITNITGDNWIKHLWDTGTGNITDSYNISANNIWYNTTINTYYQKTYTLDTWQNITVYAYNSSGNGTLSSGNISQNTFLTYTSPNSFSETVEIIEDFPQASTNILTSFLLFLPLFVGILISAALILVCVGVFGKLKRW